MTRETWKNGGSRSMSWSRAAVLGILGVFVFVPAPTWGLTLPQALDWALESSPDWNRSRLETGIRTSERIQALGSYLPSLAVSETYINTNNPLTAFGILLNEGIVKSSTLSNVNNLNNPTYTQTFGFAASLSETIFDGGNRFFGLKAAKRLEKGAGNERDWKRQTLISRVTRAYLGVIFAEREIRVVRRELVAAQADRDTARHRWEAGSLLRSEYLRARVHESHMDIMLLEAEKRATLSRLELSRLVGRPLEKGLPLAPPALFEGGVPAVLSGLSAKGERRLLGEALARRPDYLAVKEEVRARDEQVSQALSGFLPHVTVQGLYNEYNQGLSAWGQQSFTAIGQVSWDLFSGLSDKERRSRARLRLRMAEYRREDLLRTLHYEVSKSLATAAIATRSLSADAERVSQADEALRIVRSRYQVGLETVSRLLRSEARYRQAKLKSLQDRYRMDESAVDLLWATGTLSRSAPLFR
jgi:outer membrane protein